MKYVGSWLNARSALEFGKRGEIDREPIPSSLPSTFDRCQRLEGCVRTANGPNVTGWSSPKVGGSYDVKFPACS